MAITYNNLYLDIRQQLREAGVAAATLEARELVCFGTGKTREELTRDGRLYASPDLERQVRALVQRHLEGEPVAYPVRKGADTETLLAAINGILEAKRQDGTLSALSEKYFGVDLTKEG